MTSKNLCRTSARSPLEGSGLLAGPLEAACKGPWSQGLPFPWYRVVMSTIQIDPGQCPIQVPVPRHHSRPHRTRIKQRTKRETRGTVSPPTRTRCPARRIANRRFGPQVRANMPTKFGGKQCKTHRERPRQASRRDTGFPNISQYALAAPPPLLAGPPKRHARVPGAKGSRSQLVFTDFDSPSNLIHRPVDGCKT